MIETSGRNEDIYFMRSLGATYKEIATKYGISVGRARQIFLNKERRINCKLGRFENETPYKDLDQGSRHENIRMIINCMAICKGFE